MEIQSVSRFFWGTTVDTFGLFLFRLFLFHTAAFLSFSLIQAKKDEEIQRKREEIEKNTCRMDKTTDYENIETRNHLHKVMNYSQYIHSFLVSNVSSLHLSLISPSSLLPPSPPPPPPPHLGGASESLLYLLRTKRGERERDTDCLIVSAHHLNLSSKLSFSSFALSHLLLFISSCRPCFILLHRISKTRG